MSVDIHVGTQGIQHEHISFGDLRERSEIEVGALQMQILWSLSRKSMHGYDLMKALSAIKGTQVTQGTMYPALQRLVQLRLVERHTESTGERKRHTYTLTEKGLKTMNDSCLEFVKTFYGIFHDFACQRCQLHNHHQASPPSKKIPKQS
ncbi:MAG: PadR family transcriptional regulator [Candidatus Aenigmarchaeota archaeon]|nr:PadR family transcriptional regulator [Candidatus Aenigmarchaeota archaeon]